MKGGLTDSGYDRVGRIDARDLTLQAVGATPESNSDVTRRMYSAANGDWAINRRDNQTGGIIHDESD